MVLNVEFMSDMINQLIYCSSLGPSLKIINSKFCISVWTLNFSRPINRQLFVRRGLLPLIKICNFIVFFNLWFISTRWNLSPPNNIFFKFSYIIYVKFIKLFASFCSYCSTADCWTVYSVLIYILINCHVLKILLFLFVYAVFDEYPKEYFSKQPSIVV